LDKSEKIGNQQHKQGAAAYRSLILTDLGIRLTTGFDSPAKAKGNFQNPGANDQLAVNRFHPHRTQCEDIPTIRHYKNYPISAV
jgi:hypothetical protein